MAMSISQLDGMDRAGFRAVLGGIFEASPWVADEAWAKRPFGNRGKLHAAMVNAVASAGEGRQLDLIRAHPDLAGKAARAGSLSEASTREQTGAGVMDCRRALDEADGNMARAEELLRAKGAAAAAKK